MYLFMKVKIDSPIKNSTLVRMNQSMHDMLTNNHHVIIEFARNLMSS
jgi:hypothetical protein